MIIQSIYLPLRFEYNDFGEMNKHYTYRSPNAVITEEPGTNGDTTSYTYDTASGLLKAKTFADGNSTTYTYDTQGNLSSRTWARGVVTSYTYDKFGQLLKTAYSDNTPSITNTYDDLGRLKTVQDAKGTTTFAYNQYGETVTETVSGLYNKSLVRTYDDFGRELSYGIDGNVKRSLTYDSAGRIATMNNQFTWNYMENANLKSSVTYPGDIAVEYQYEPNRDLLTQVKNSRSGNAISQYDYTNDVLGRRTAMSKSGNMMSANDTIDYNYNPRSEVTGANAQNTNSYKYAFNYDNIGNRIFALENTTNKNYTTNALNQYTSNTGFSPMYDLDGNQTKIKTSTGEWEITYNGENRPIKFMSGNKRIEMSYDYMGRRVWLAYWVNNAVEKERKFMYNDYTLVQEMKWDNSVLKEYIWDPTAGMATKPLIFKYLPKGYTLFYTHDGNKNVSDLVYYATANGIGAHYEYSPFGATVVSTSNSRITDASIRTENPFRFSSEYHDDELGLIYYNYRHYNTMDGKWLSRDPIEEQGGWNLYGMVKNNLINTYDIRGMGTTIVTEDADGNQETIILEDGFTNEELDNLLKKIEKENKKIVLFDIMGHGCSSYIIMNDISLPFLGFWGGTPTNGSTVMYMLDGRLYVTYTDKNGRTHDSDITDALKKTLKDEALFDLRGCFTGWKRAENISKLISILFSNITVRGSKGALMGCFGCQLMRLSRDYICGKEVK